MNYIDKEKRTFDAIVVGSGISGGWAAKELTEKGMKTIMLERGPMKKHGQYPKANKAPWEFPNNGLKPTKEALERKSKQNRTGYAILPFWDDWFVDDIDNPYTEEERFDWIRGYHVGGRSVTWGRQSYRLGPHDFLENKKDGHGVDWPVRYEEIAPWYDYVESYIGVSGSLEGLPHLPDGKFLPEMELNCVEKDFKKTVESKFPGRNIIPGRTAHATELVENRGGKCQFRNMCMRGCPYAGYFSSLSSTIPAAERTGNLTIQADAIVTELIYDKDKKKAIGVRYLNAQTNEIEEYYAKVIFLCASTFGSTFIMMNSKSDRFPTGFGNDSDQLGRNIMDHHLNVGASAKVEGYENQYYSGRRPNGFYVPRFRNLVPGEKNDFVRGYGFQGSARRGNWKSQIAEMNVGNSLKEAISHPGQWTIGYGGFGEILPYEENRVTLNNDLKDKWGLPTLSFNAILRDNELKMRKDIMNTAAEMLEAAGFKDIYQFDNETGVGLGIHEMGTARMGRDPKTSVLNKFNQVHACKNVYVTDGSFMTSAGNQNPSLTYMAFTARAVDHAIKEINKSNI